MFPRDSALTVQKLGCDYKKDDAWLMSRDLGLDFQHEAFFTVQGQEAPGPTLVMFFIHVSLLSEERGGGFEVKEFRF